MLHKCRTHLGAGPSRGLCFHENNVNLAKKFRTRPSNIRTSFWYIYYFELKALEKQQMRGGAVSELPLWAKENSVVISPFSRVSSITQGGLTPVTGETRSRRHTQMNVVTNGHTSYLLF